MATWDGHALAPGEDFVLSAAVGWRGETAGLGLVFGYLGVDDGYELQLVNRDQSPDGVLDVRLLTRRGGVEETVLRFDDLVRLEHPSGRPVDFGRGRFTPHPGGAPFPPLQDIDAFATCP